MHHIKKELEETTSKAVPLCRGPQGDRDAQSFDDCRCRYRHADHGSRRSAGISDQTHHTDRAVDVGRSHRHRDARDRRQRVKGAWPADSGRQQGRRRRHGRPGHHGGRSKTGWLHRRADADHGVPFALDAAGFLGCRERLYLCHQSHRLHVRRHRQRRRAVQDLAGRDRLCQEKPRQGYLRDTRQRDLAAYRHGAGRGAGGDQTDSGTFQGHRGDQRRCAWPAHDVAGGLPRDGVHWSMPENCAC